MTVSPARTSSPIWMTFSPAATAREISISDAPALSGFAEAAEVRAVCVYSSITTASALEGNIPPVWINAH
ncbi:MAG: hypothetical protein PGMFKBFP_01448 [Anaerolineales bacterium]|nr:hypothetical protein [Anaerolineales bacterium]